jgi:uncharacterized zinc-type alcohol dehydrogenase-like protein
MEASGPLQSTNKESAQDKPIPPCADNEYREVAWGIEKWGEKFKPLWINRPKVGDNDVKFEMKYCGICHSDVHLGLNHLGGSMYPIVPGHELVGTVTEVGSKVTKVKVGDNVGVGCIKDSCLKCDTCKTGDEQYCEGGGNTHTYNSMKTYGHIGGNPDTQNFGGYTGSEVVHEHFIIKIPDAIPLEKAGPILCAGITLYDPLKHWGACEGKPMTIGIVGIGGLGTMGIKLAKALGHTVGAISTSKGKEALAKEKGASIFVVSTDADSIAANSNKFDLILNTVSAKHEVMTYIPLLKTNGTIVQLGLVPEPHTMSQLPLVFKRKAVAGSLIGGISNTEELLKLCAEKNVTPDVELIEADKIDWAWEQLVTVNKDGIRYVIDIKKSLANPAL